MNARNHEVILEGIAKLRRRWVRVHFVRFALQSLFYLLLVSALALLVFTELDPGTLVLSLVALAVVSGVGAAILGRPSQATLAKDYDDAVGLKDRVSSSVELMAETSPMIEALTVEAARATRDMPPGRVYPYHVPREGWWLPVPVMLIAAVLLLPGFLNADPPANPEFELSVENRIEGLEDLLSKERNKELTPRRKELMEELEKLKALLSKEKVDRKDTMAEVSKLLDQLEQERADEQEKELELKKMLKSLQEKTGRKDLDDHLQNGDYQQALNKLREELEELQKKLDQMKKDGATPEELKALEELIEELKEIEAKLMQLLALNIDMDMLGPTIDFLMDWDGELGDLSDMVPAEMFEPGEP